MSRLTTLSILALAALAQNLAFGQLPNDLCCARKPSYASRYGRGMSGSFSQGQIAVSTMWARGSSFFPIGQAGPMPDQDLVIWNIAPKQIGWWFLYPAKNVDLAPAGGYYTDARWNYNNLGDVFGMTIDDQGNIYVTATTIYGFSPSYTPRIGGLDTNAGNSHGQIYKIENGTGNPKLFARLPNPNGAGLGNITFDCSRHTFYVSNFDDGLIYQLDTAGNVLHTFDHGALVGINGQDSQGYAKQGRRPWAVRVHAGRLYYSIWNMDNGNHFGGTPNQIWSIALNQGGWEVGMPRVEVSLPQLNAATIPWSNPVSDITFGPSGTMFAAERTMQGDNLSYSHSSRLLAFDYKLVGWNWTWVAAAPTYAVGCYSGYLGYPANAAGGVDLDLSPNAVAPLWATGDALHRMFSGYTDNVWGLQGLPITGGTVTNSTLIDLDNNTGNSWDEEVQLGVVRVPCPATQPSLAVPANSSIL